jgi:hypothetical protein
VACTPSEDRESKERKTKADYNDGIKKVERRSLNHNFQPTYLLDPHSPKKSRNKKEKRGISKVQVVQRVSTFMKSFQFRKAPAQKHQRPSQHSKFP